MSCISLEEGEEKINLEDYILVAGGLNEHAQKISYYLRYSIAAIVNAIRDQKRQTRLS